MNAIQNLFNDSFLMQLRSESKELAVSNTAIKKQNLSIAPYVVRPTKTNKLERPVIIGADVQEKGDLKAYRELAENFEHEYLIWRVTVKSTGKHATIGNFAENEQVITQRVLCAENTEKMAFILATKAGYNKALSTLETIKAGLENGTIQDSDETQSAISRAENIISAYELAYNALVNGMQFYKSINEDNGQLNHEPFDMNMIAPNLSGQIVNLMIAYYEKRNAEIK